MVTHTCQVTDKETLAQSQEVPSEAGVTYFRVSKGKSCFARLLSSFANLLLPRGLHRLKIERSSKRVAHN